MFFKDILFPKCCIGCGFLGAYICPQCQKELRIINGESCFYCGKKSLYGLTHIGCRRKYQIDGVMSILHYNNLLKKIIKNFKYRLAKDVWNDFCLIVKPFFIEKIKFYQKIDNGTLFVQPIPLYDKKLRQRGFNQSEIIADYFNKFLKFPTSAVLIRKKETLTQASITDVKRRYFNMKNAFGVVDEKAVKNKHFVIIDDVLTSGSTVHSAARVLKINGARKAYVLTLAKG